MDIQQNKYCEDILLVTLGKMLCVCQLDDFHYAECRSVESQNDEGYCTGCP
jgi:hypothetical protein